MCLIPGFIGFFSQIYFCGEEGHEKIDQNKEVIPSREKSSLCLQKNRCCQFVIVQICFASIGFGYEQGQVEEC